jgi:hypothetical protein
VLPEHGEDQARQVGRVRRSLGCVHLLSVNRKQLCALNPWGGRRFVIQKRLYVNLIKNEVRGSPQQGASVDVIDKSAANEKLKRK